MSQTFWHYKNADLNISIDRVPIYFKVESEDGTNTKGSITFVSHNDFDEVWGPDSKFIVSWEPADRITYNHGKKVKETINVYNSINVAVSKKETDWQNSHENTRWYGGRKQMIRRRLYTTKEIHSVMLCEITSRVIEAHSTTILSLFPNYEPFINDAFRTLRCHEV